MHRWITTAGLLTILLALPAALCSAEDWITDCERSDFRETPPYEATVDYCKRLAEASDWVHYTTFGVSPQGRDLPLLVVDRRGHFSPDAVRSTRNAVILIEAGIHSGEIAGKDAGLMLLRDLVMEKKHSDLLRRVTILFIPIFNVDGHERSSPYNRINQNGPAEMGWRATAQNLNLNRDFLKADAPEMQDWVRLFVEWLPDFFVDCHTTDGADYQYAISYGLELHGNLAPGLTGWTRDIYLPFIEKEMDASGFPLIPYVWFRERHEPKSGIISWVAPPALSEGYAALHNRVGLLVETHMLKDYRTRVMATYEILRHTLALLAREHETIVRLGIEADRLTASSRFREEPLPVQYTSTSDSVIIDFLGYEYEVEESDLTGGPWHKYTNIPVTWRIPHFNKQVPAASVRLPEAYVIPAEWGEVIRRLEMHGVAVERLREPEEIRVTSYRFRDVHWSERPYEGRHRARYEVEEMEEVRTFPPGSALIDMNQRAARVAAHVLEPEAPDSYVGWGFFDPIFERKEYTETYVMEAMAREMIAANPGLEEEFRQAVSEDSTLAGDQWGALLWFYRRTPYWDDRMNVYPVGKIVERSVVERLKH